MNCIMGKYAPFLMSSNVTSTKKILLAKQKQQLKKKQQRKGKKTHIDIAFQENFEGDGKIENKKNYNDDNDVKSSDKY